jgi:hypothetical protein
MPKGKDWGAIKTSFKKGAKMTFKREDVQEAFLKKSKFCKVLHLRKTMDQKTGILVPRTIRSSEGLSFDDMPEIAIGFQSLNLNQGVIVKCPRGFLEMHGGIEDASLTLSNLFDSTIFSILFEGGFRSIEQDFKSDPEAFQNALVGHTSQANNSFRPILFFNSDFLEPLFKSKGRLGIQQAPFMPLFPNKYLGFIGFAEAVMILGDFFRNKERKAGVLIEPESVGIALSLPEIQDEKDQTKIIQNFKLFDLEKESVSCLNQKPI